MAQNGFYINQSSKQPKGDDSNSDDSFSGDEGVSLAASTTVPSKAQNIMDSRLNGRPLTAISSVEMERTAEFTLGEDKFDASKMPTASPSNQNASRPTLLTQTSSTSNISSSRGKHYTAEEKAKIMEGHSQGLTAQQIIVKYQLSRTADRVANYIKRQLSKQQSTGPLAESTNPPQATSATPILIDDSNSNTGKRSSFGGSTSSLLPPTNPTLNKITQALTPPPAVPVLAPVQVVQPPSPAMSQPGKRKATSVLGEEPHKKQRKITDMSRVPSEPPAMSLQELWELYMQTKQQVNELTVLSEQLRAQNEAVTADRDRLKAESEQWQVEKAELLAKLRACEEWKAKSITEVAEILRQQARSERSEARTASAQNSMRLGHIGYERTGAEIFEHWIDGKEYIELRSQRQSIESEMKQIEILKSELQKQGKNRRKSTSTSSISNSAAIAAATEEDDEEVATQAEVYKTRLAILKKLDGELEEKAGRLDIEKALLIKELKRLSDEDHSQWNNYPVLGDGKFPQRYVLLHLVGKGGFSEVYKAYDLIEQRPVACKIHQLASHWSKAKRESYYRHAIREGQIQERMAHARVVRLFNIFSIDDSSFCTVMEYCPGGDLDTYLKKQTCLPEAEARSIVAQIFQGLRYMNEQEKPVIHYDLKPGNIMFDEFGGVKITDFGLSKTVEAGDSSIELTSQGAGTYWYLPPECFDSPRDLGRQVKISNKVDVWSCGVIFYQMLYGKKPFGDKMSQQKILMENTIATAQLDFPPKSSKGNVSKEAQDFIRRLLTRSPAQRPDVFAACADSYLQVSKKKGNMGPPSSRKKGAAVPGLSSASPSTPQQLPLIALGASAGVPGYQQQPPPHDPMDTS
eukprot:TRINITY_DN4698_c0_g1_i1.p1 TRINITY_DN4698_c0_g1~~TRINITY_DN4698_c0_g1_i1.p1  ORF type:complete len:879 (-),score=166.01 TRINITY_DN4698_c0_g1_i1:68-2644(-)